MSPVLSPAEQQEVARFGLFDEEILRDIAAHMDDVLGCTRENCDTPAAWSITTRCCGQGSFLCTLHLIRAKASCLQLLRRYGTAECDHCHTQTPTPCGFEDIFRVVPV